MLVTLPFSLFEIRRSAITPSTARHVFAPACALRRRPMPTSSSVFPSPHNALPRYKKNLLSQFVPLQLDVQLFRGSLPSGGICTALPSIARRNSVAMMLLSIRMSALKKDVVTTLIAHHGTIMLCTVCCKHALICCGMSRMHDMMIYNILLNCSRGFLLISYFKRFLCRQCPSLQ